MRRTDPAARTPLEEFGRARNVLPRVLVGVGLLGGIALVLVLTGWGGLLWGVFSEREAVQRRIDGAGALGPVLYVVFLVVQAVVAPLPAPAVAMAGGYSFGVVEGFLLTWVGCLIGGVISFGISRLFGRDFVAGSAGRAPGPLRGGARVGLDLYPAAHPSNLLRRH